MAIQTINIGTSANKGDGDPLRVAFDKINKNFAELDVTNTVKDIKGSVFADDSTVLVDSVNGTLNASALSGSLPAIDGSALTGLTVQTASNLVGDMKGSVYADDSTLLVDGVNGSIPHSVLSGTPTTISGYGITDAYTKTEVDSAITSSVLPSGSSQSIDIVADDSTLLIDSVNGTINSSVLTKPIKLNDNEKITFGDDDDIQIYHHNNGTSIIQNATGQLQLRSNTVRLLNAATTKDFAYFNNNGSVDLYYDGTKKFSTSAGGIQIEEGVEEKFATLTGQVGTVDHDCNNGHVFYHTGATGAITANFTNLDLTAEYATNLTVIINQGATAYEVNAVQIGGAVQTIEWQGGSAPTGTANGIDSFSFTILNDGGSYVVLGQMVDFT